MTMCPSCGAALNPLAPAMSQSSKLAAPYGSYPPGAYPPGSAPLSVYEQGPSRPSKERHGSDALVIALVVILAVAVLGGVGTGAYELTVKPTATRMSQTTVATATATVPSNAILHDTLSNNNNDWPTDTTNHCFFSADGYHVSNPQKSGYYEYWCGAPIGRITDGSVTVTVQQVGGAMNQPYGIAFRFTETTGVEIDDYYWFVIDSGGNWALFRHVNGKFTRLQDYTRNFAILSGLNEKNTLSVQFRGQRITCAVNGVGVGIITDSGSSLGAGFVALEVGANVNAAFTDFLATP